MYRSAGKLLIEGSLRTYNGRCLPTSHLPSIINSTRLSTTTASNQSTNTHSPNENRFKFTQSANPNDSESSSTSQSSSETGESSSTTSSAKQEAPRFDGRSPSDRRPRVEYKDEQARVLLASLHHVNRLGWTEAAMMAGAREVGVSPSIVGSFPRKEAALVEYFMDDCLQRLIDIIDSREDLKTLIPSDCISQLVKIRLEMQAPYISRWAQALSIQALPVNLPTSFKQRAMLVGEIWDAAGDATSDIDWYVKRTVLGGIYSTAEVYMLTDNSPDFRDTWAFLDARVRDAFDLKKTMQEARYLAEAVSAGVGGSLQGLMKRVFQG